jgi:hypothetical protein
VLGLVRVAGGGQIKCRSLSDLSWHGVRVSRILCYDESRNSVYVLITNIASLVAYSLLVCRTKSLLCERDAVTGRSERPYSLFRQCATLNRYISVVCARGLQVVAEHRKTSCATKASTKVRTHDVHSRIRRIMASSLAEARNSHKLLRYRQLSRRLNTRTYGLEVFSTLRMTTVIHDAGANYCSRRGRISVDQYLHTFENFVPVYR